MKALLLAAGLGTRLKPLTDTIPKCLVPINGKPLLEYWLEMLVDAGIEDILVNTHYLADTVSTFIENSKFNKFVTIVYEPKLLGTGGTLLQNRALLDNDSVMLIHADNLSRFNMRSFIERHERRSSEAEITMMTFTTDDPQSCGIVELDQNELVIAFHEKVENPPGNLANGAVYILEPGIFDFLKAKGKKEIDFSNEVLPEYLHRIFTFYNSDYHRDIGNMKSYDTACKEFC